MAFYGLFLICCGITAVSFIGKKAKTAMVSGGTSGLISFVIAFLFYSKTPGAVVAGIVVPLALFIVFCWRSTKTFFLLADLIAARHEDVKGKAIAFLIISLMAVVSISVLLVNVALL